MELVKILEVMTSAGCNGNRLWIMVKPLPTGAIVSIAGRTGVAPDPTIVLQLIQLVTRCLNGNRLWIMVKPLPTGAIVSIAGRTGVAPDPAIVVQLIELVSIGGYGDCLLPSSLCHPVHDSPWHGVPV